MQSQTRLRILYTIQAKNTEKQAKNGLQLRSTLLEMDIIMDYHGLSWMTIMDEYHR